VSDQKITSLSPSSSRRHDTASAHNRSFWPVAALYQAEIQRLSMSASHLKAVIGNAQILK